MSPKSPFERVSPESQGVSSAAISAFIDGVESEHLGLHSFMLLRHGRVVAEGWWRPYAPEIPHVLYSLTKSFTSAAAGLAISEGRLNLDDPVVSFFPRDVPKSPSQNLRDMRVRDLLSMVTGHEEDPGMQISRRPPKEWVRGFFETPVPYPPGTHFVYNSTGSHMISVIVQKVTGQTLVNYLRDRLFRPLGISRPYWETSPAGQNWGGWGLYLRTDEVARFGQMLLQRGMWQGQQLLPAAWIDQATSKQVPNGDDPNSDWAQGYGFQFWMSRHGFRGDGAFGQFCVVLAERDLVLVTTASTPDMQAILNAAWRTLLPGLSPAALPENPSDLAALRDRLEDLEIDGPRGASSSPCEAGLSGRAYSLESNPFGWDSLQVQRDGANLLLALRTADGEKTVSLGMMRWQADNLQLDYPMELPVATSARWTDECSLDAAICYLNPAATRTLKLRLDGDTLEVRTALYGTFAPPIEVVVKGRTAGNG